MTGLDIAADGMAAPFSCPVCGGNEFRQRHILWPELVEAWELDEAEAVLIDRQQGFCCASCDCNLRSMTMAAALLREYRFDGVLRDFVQSDTVARTIRLLEVNEAGDLTPYLSQFELYTLARYPDVDMRAMPYTAGSFDLLVHGDTLEHIADPVRALEECGRVLSPAGKLLFTIPIVPSKLTRRRQGLPPSFHGSRDTNAEDYMVQTEYGADFYIDLLDAGFKEITLHTLDGASSLCLACGKP